MCTYMRAFEIRSDPAFTLALFSHSLWTLELSVLASIIRCSSSYPVGQLRGRNMYTDLDVCPVITHSLTVLFLLHAEGACLTRGGLS